MINLLSLNTIHILTLVKISNFKQTMPNSDNKQTMPDTSDKSTVSCSGNKSKLLNLKNKLTSLGNKITLLNPIDRSRDSMQVNIEVTFRFVLNLIFAFTTMVLLQYVVELQPISKFLIVLISILFGAQVLNLTREDVIMFITVLVLISLGGLYENIIKDNKNVNNTNNTNDAT